MALFTPLAEVRALAASLEEDREALAGCALAVHGGRHPECGRGPLDPGEHLAWHAQVCADKCARLGDAVLCAEGGAEGVAEARRAMDTGAWRAEMRLHGLCSALQAEQESLHAAWDRAADVGYEAPEEGREGGGGGAAGGPSGFQASRDEVEVGALLTAARNMARVAYAPPGWRLGMPLPGDSKPPAPAEADLVASLLHLPLPGDGERQVERLEAAERAALGGDVGVSKGYLGRVQRRERRVWAAGMERLVDASVKRDREGGLAGRLKSKGRVNVNVDVDMSEARQQRQHQQPGEAKEKEAAPRSVPLPMVPPPMPVGWKPGDPVPLPPPMPAGWKPGDPLP